MFSRFWFNQHNEAFCSGGNPVVCSFLHNKKIALSHSEFRLILNFHQELSVNNIEQLIFVLVTMPRHFLPLYFDNFNILIIYFANNLW